MGATAAGTAGRRSPEAGSTVSRVNPRLVYWLAALYDHPELTAAHRDVLVFVATRRLDFGSGGGYCSEAAIAEGVGCTERTARRALAWGRKLGLIERTRRGYRRGDGVVRSSEWQVIYPPPRLQSVGSASAAEPAPDLADAGTCTGQAVPVESALYRTGGSGRGRLNRTQETPQQVVKKPTGGEELPNSSAPTSLRSVGAAAQRRKTPPPGAPGDDLAVDAWVERKLGRRLDGFASGVVTGMAERGVSRVVALNMARTLMEPALHAGQEASS